MTRAKTGNYIGFFLALGLMYTLCKKCIDMREMGSLK